MSTTALVTAAELLKLPTGMGERYELITGELRVMSPSGWRHGEVVDNLQFLLGNFIRKHGLGRGFGAETGFLLTRDPDTVRAPDFAFIAKEHLPTQKPSEAYWPGAPDLAVEVLSPGDRAGEVDEKIEAWLAAGAVAVWIVNPNLQTVMMYQPNQPAQIRSPGEILQGDPVLPGFSCPVDELFL